MNMQELQDRANAIVQRVNNYEASLEKEQGDETKLLSEHKYCDIHCLRAVYDWITGCDFTRKANTTLNSTVNGKLFDFDVRTNQLSQTTRNKRKLQYTTGNLKWTAWQDVNNADSHNTYTGITEDSATANYINMHYNLAIDCGNMRIDTRSSGHRLYSQRFSGWSIQYGAHIADALIVESQVVNLYDLDYFMVDAYSNSLRIGWWTAEENYLCSAGINLFSARSNEYKTPPPTIFVYEGRPLISKNKVINTLDRCVFGTCPNRESQNIYCRSENDNSYRLKLFIPCSSTTGGTSSYNSFQPEVFNKVPSNNRNPNTRKQWQTENWAQQTYFELAFKRRRAGCKAAGLDFIPTLDTVMDNDPQGLATRFALAQCKPYYRGRPWWTELDELYTENGEYQAKLADAILEASESMNDLEYLQNYKLDYETVANVMEWPL